MKNIVSLAVACISFLFLTACGSDTSSATVYSKKISLSGAVVDGYISGATVCLDLNNNGSCDISEPRAISSSSGAFSFSTLDVSDRDFLVVVASGGKDTATGKNFVDKFKSVLDISEASQAEQIFVTPLTDLISGAFLNSATKTSPVLQDITAQIAYAYRISEDIVHKSPMQYAGVFAKTQEIQQTIALMEVAAAKAKGVSLTSLELLQLKSDIKKAIVTQIATDTNLDIAKVLTNLETISKITIPDNEKTFIVAQIAEIKKAIDTFVQNTKLTTTYINKFQAALETEEEKAFAALENAVESAYISPLVININVFELVPDTNTTEINTTIISFGGVMADGYISGATVCLDMNSDGICTIAEPSVTTSTTGTFNFSNTTVQKNTFIPLIGFGGIDTASGALFQGEFQSILDVNTTSATTLIAITPFTDLMRVQFSKSSIKDKTALNTSVKDVADAFGVSSEVLMQDTMLDVGVFAKSQEMQQIKSLIELIAKRAMSTTLTAAQKKDLQSKIKKALLAQLLESGYEALDISRVLSTLEIDMRITISTQDKTFVIAQLGEIRGVLSTLAKDTNIYVWTLPRLQSMLESALAPAYLNARYTDLNLTAAIVTNSIFDKTDALYDTQACLKDTYYKNTLIDTNATLTRKEDLTNGISVNSDYGAVTLYYPSLEVVKSNENIVIFEEKYYFSFDRAWINTGKQIYIETPQDASGLYGCYKVKLNSDMQSEIELIQVYRYLDFHL